LRVLKKWYFLLPVFKRGYRNCDASSSSLKQEEQGEQEEFKRRRRRKANGEGRKERTNTLSILSMDGATSLQGPHQEAQKSTKTGIFDSNTTSSNSFSLMPGAPLHLVVVPP
jgi:hypothetical protein